MDLGTLLTLTRFCRIPGTSAGDAVFISIFSLNQYFDSNGNYAPLTKARHCAYRGLLRVMACKTRHHMKNPAHYGALGASIPPSPIICSFCVFRLGDENITARLHDATFSLRIIEAMSK